MSGKDPSPKRLGRGLSALFGDAANAQPAPLAEARVKPPAPTPQAEIRDLPIASLEPSPFQPRSHISAEPLEELTDSIRERGILQPLLVRPHPTQAGRYQIIAGERRWRAAQAVPLHTVPVLVRNLADADAAAAALVENLQRADLDPIEEAVGLNRLVEDHGLAQVDVGRMVGKSRSHVANMIRLLNLPAALQAMLREGGLTIGHARALLTAKDPVALARLVIERGLSVRQTEALVAAPPRPDTPPARRDQVAERADPNTAALERSLTEHLGLAVNITTKGRGGELRIRYNDLDQLDGLLTLLNRS